MHFFSDFETASQDILFKVGQEAVSKYGEKGAKSGCSEYWDRFIALIIFQLQLLKRELESAGFLLVMLVRHRLDP